MSANIEVLGSAHEIVVGILLGPSSDGDIYHVHGELAGVRPSQSKSMAIGSLLLKSDRPCVRLEFNDDITEQPGKVGEFDIEDACAGIKIVRGTYKGLVDDHPKVQFWVDMGTIMPRATTWNFATRARKECPWGVVAISISKLDPSKISWNNADISGRSAHLQTLITMLQAPGKARDIELMIMWDPRTQYPDLSHFVSQCETIDKQKVKEASAAKQLASEIAKTEESASRQDASDNVSATEPTGSDAVNNLGTPKCAGRGKIAGAINHQRKTAKEAWKAIGKKQAKVGFGSTEFDIDKAESAASKLQAELDIVKARLAAIGVLQGIHE